MSAPNFLLHLFPFCTEKRIKKSFFLFPQNWSGIYETYLPLFMVGLISLSQKFIQVKALNVSFPSFCSAFLSSFNKYFGAYSMSQVPL